MNAAAGLRAARCPRTSLNWSTLVKNHPENVLPWQQECHREDAAMRRKCPRKLEDA